MTITNHTLLDPAAAERLREAIAEGLAQRGHTGGEAILDVGTTTWDTINGQPISNPPFQPQRGTGRPTAR